MSNLDSIIEITEIAEIASKWWANDLMLPVHNNADPSLGLAVLFATQLSQSTKKITEQSLFDFKNTLKEYIINELLEKGVCKIENKLLISGILKDITKKLNIDVTPSWCTTMIISIEEIKVKRGFDSQEICLYGGIENSKSL